LTEKDGASIKDFLDKSKGRYKKLIIDIRNNGGGATEYFYNNLIRPFLDKPVTYKQVTGIRRKFLSETKPSYLQYLRKHVSTSLQGVVDILEVNPPIGFNPEDWTFYEIVRKIYPMNQYNFNGKVFILTQNCFSAADDYVNTLKRIGLGTLVGQNTNGGGAAYFAPVFVRLPNSGMILMLEADLLLNPDGSINELFGTKPDIELKPYEFIITNEKSELIKDAWIKKIVDEL
jgi:C-terminal processing protease CtpA/Prc